jgi:hypothetical protein
MDVQPDKQSDYRGYFKLGKKQSATVAMLFQEAKKS